MMPTELGPSLRILFPLVILSPSHSPLRSLNSPSFGRCGRSTPLQLSPGILVENSPGACPGSSLFCQRVGIHVFLRISNISILAHSVKLKVLSKAGSPKPTKFEVCFHRFTC
ncbi:hypothetical protein MLD38_009292 [Melastoma candidum]|uniref:Uncharacterized protein n=1 Tax=Melastoma candidum TaxID=119954 RepID=A0ACB9RWS1_9MYRT|nr:hypothetical protein MLD38_009292 [Melastoma candidum]